MERRTNYRESATRRFLVPQEVAEILRVSLATVYNLIRRGQLKAIRVSKRITLISNDNLESMLAKAELNKTLSAHALNNGNYADVESINEPLYTLQEVCTIYNYTYGRFYNLRLRYNIPCLLIGGTKHFPQRAVDNAMEQENTRLGRNLREEWYTCFDLMNIYGLGKTQVRRFALTHGVRTKRIHGNRLYYLKSDWEAARREAEKKSESTKPRRNAQIEKVIQETNLDMDYKTIRRDWYSTDDIMRIYGLKRTQVLRYAREHNITVNTRNRSCYLINKAEWDAERQKALLFCPNRVMKRKIVNA